MTTTTSRSKLFLRIGIALAILVALVALAGKFASSSGGDATVRTTGSQVWTCSMHPQVRLPKPGKCPICSMPLVPTAAATNDGTGGKTARKIASYRSTMMPGEVSQTPRKDSMGMDMAPVFESEGSMLELSEHARAMASVETVAVERRKLSREIRAVGKVQYNESALSTITARVDGYIERLFIDYTGVEVKTGDHLVEIYSPDLAVAQQELIMNAGSGIAEAVKLKLRRWELTDAQIDEIVRTRKPQERITLSSPINGTVTEKMVVQKSAVKAGDVLYKLANLDSVWVYLDIYEYELASVRYGQTAEITTEAYPGELFTGRVWFINAVLTDESRTVKVLVNIANKDKRLKPGMFVSATIRAGLLGDGQLAPTGVEGKWTCLMHPQVLEVKDGPCPVCKMALTQIPTAGVAAKPEDELIVAVPVTAVLDSGLRKIAYVERAPGQYVPAALKLGSRAGAFYPVLDGLKEGDRVAVRGNFLLDSQFQISGLPSLFYEHGQAPAAGHQHGAAADKAAPAPKPVGHEGHAPPKPAEPKP
jgi:Cu(I)/Ag(I) efflux system membrane fusion protein